MNLDLERVMNSAAPVLSRLLSPGAAIPESWRWPVIERADDRHNSVMFLWDDRLAPSWARGQAPSVCCSANESWRRMPMQRVQESLWALQVTVPLGQVHRYRFIVGDVGLLDPVNPQRVTLDSGDVWSRFFTWYCTEPLSFERWQLTLLDRLVRHLLPFNDSDARQFLSREGQDPMIRRMDRLDVSVGVVNFIDKLVACQERHHLVTYQLGLEMIDGVLRRRNPYDDIGSMSKEMFLELYTDLAISSGSQGRLGQSGWQFHKYGDPRYFFNVLRRHVWTGAFAHPKYGGNALGLAWKYLDDRFGASGGPGFDWKRIMEPPLGQSADYKG